MQTVRRQVRLFEVLTNFLGVVIGQLQIHDVDWYCVGCGSID